MGAEERRPSADRKRLRRGPRPDHRLPRGKRRGVSPARETALMVLLAAERSGRFVADLVRRQIAEAGLSEPDRALATEIVYGVVRRRATLDAVIAAYSDTKLWRLDSRILWILRLAIYQMLFLTRVPVPAAVDEAVRLTRRHAPGHLAGFVNGVLRTLSRAVTQAGPLADRVAGPRHVIPIDSERTVVIARAVLPDPQRDPVAYLSTAYSYPEWLVRRWWERFGEEETRRLLAVGNERPRIYLRVNRLRGSREELADRLGAAGVAVEPAPVPWALELLDSRNVTELPGFAEGWFYVQDLTAMEVAPRLEPRPGQRILDLCAAPGGKSTHLAELMNNIGLIVAADQSQQRLELLRQNIQRLGADIVRPTLVEEVEGEFDGVLLDAPCTNTGVLARRAEARWRLSQEALDRAVAEQRRLIELAASHTKPGGRLLYSTCSIEPEENQQLIAHFLQHHPDFSLAEEHLTLPQPERDGGYAALLLRGGTGRE